MFLSSHDSASSQEGTIATSRSWPATTLRSLTIVLCLLLAISGLAAGQTNPKHFFWAKGQAQTPDPNALASDLIYHGGNAGS